MVSNEGERVEFGSCTAISPTEAQSLKRLSSTRLRTSESTRHALLQNCKATRLAHTRKRTTRMVECRAEQVLVECGSEEVLTEEVLVECGFGRFGMVFGCRQRNHLHLGCLLHSRHLAVLPNELNHHGGLFPTGSARFHLLKGAGPSWLAYFQRRRRESSRLVE